MLNILIVDDSHPRVELIKNAIGSSEYAKHLKVVVCDTADSAREELGRDFDLLILDILLPKKLNSTPQAVHSTNLLLDISNPNKDYIRPGLIIGLTADVSELTAYQEAFLQHASVVLDGSLKSIDWIEKLLYQIGVLITTKQRKGQKTSNKVLISVHGIRTYGQWQSSLNKEVSKYVKSFSFFEIKYGFFDLLSFIVPALRKRKIRNTSERLSKILFEHSNKDIHIVAHSFGTLIVAQAIKDQSNIKLKSVIFCGSPLSHNFNIDHIVESAEKTINDCGTRDGILVLARTLLLGLGDAGRIGFARENSSNFINRFFQGGHSLYFSKKINGLSFHEKFWLPILISDASPESHDARTNYLGEDLFDISIKALTIIKPIVYASLLLAPLYLILR